MTKRPKPFQTSSGRTVWHCKAGPVWVAFMADGGGMDSEESQEYLHEVMRRSKIWIDDGEHPDPRALARDGIKFGKGWSK